MTSTRLYRRLLSYARPYWAGFGVAALAMLVTAATETAFPALLRPLLDQGFSGTSAFQVWWVPTAVLIIFVVRGVSIFLASYAMSWVANGVLRDLRQAMFNKLLSLPAATFDKRSSGQLISRVIAEVNGVTNAATNVVNTLVRDTLILTGLMGWLFWLNWKLTLVVLVLLPFLAGLTLAFSKRMRRVSREALAATSEMTRCVEEVISGQRVVKVFQSQEQESSRFGRINSNFRGQSMRMAVAQALQTPISQLIAAIGVAAVLTIALVQSRQGVSTVGDFVSFVTAMLMMMGPLRHLADINGQLQRGLASAESVFELIDEKSERDTGSRIIGRARGEIEFDRVTLSYANGRGPALNEISLRVAAGQTVAFVGPSGSGKTSLINLLPRIYEPSSGLVRLDGIPIKELSLGSLRSQIAMVSQDIVLFNDSILNNINYGAVTASDAELWAAIQTADLEAFIGTLPNGLQTNIGDRGVRLSGGQRQRIAIARAILKNAPILILDEATSSLDSVSEASVKMAVDQLRQGRTTLIVAHRLSTISSADWVVVMSRGSVVQQGSHDRLILESGLYEQLYSEQSH